MSLSVVGYAFNGWFNKTLGHISSLLSAPNTKGNWGYIQISAQRGKSNRFLSSIADR
jgi:hypothetical protein